MPDVTVTSDIDTFLKSSNNSTARTNLGAESAPTSIANKEAAYALTGVAVGTVYKTTDTGQVLEYRGGGESLPTSWQFNVTVDGGSKNAKLSDIPAGNPAGIVRMVSTKTSNLSVTVKHDGTESATGICYSVDGGAPVYGAIAADTSLNLSIPHNGGAPTEIYIWSATSASSGKKGELTYLSCNNNSLTSLDVSGLTALTYLYCSNNSLTSLLATGVDLSFAMYGAVGSDIGDNDLTEAALIAFVDSLATTATGLIAYGGNIGSAEFETWLATGDDKGYIWLNS